MQQSFAENGYSLVRRKGTFSSVIPCNTGVCKINGVVIVANCCYSTGFSTTNNNKNIFFLQTPVLVVVLVVVVAVLQVEQFQGPERPQAITRTKMEQS